MRAALGYVGLIADDTRQTIVFSGEGKRYEGRNTNRKRILQYQIDGGMLTSGMRCDYALGVEVERKFVLVELKGKHLRHAAMQILATIGQLGGRLNNLAIHARIVLSRTPRPDIRSSELISLE